MPKRRDRESDACREAAQPVFWQLTKLADAINAVQDAVLPEPGEKQLALEPADSTFGTALSSWSIEHAPPHAWTNPVFTGLNGTFRESYKALILGYLAFLGTTRYRRQVESDGKLEEVEQCFGVEGRLDLPDLSGAVKEVLVKVYPDHHHVSRKSHSSPSTHRRADSFPLTNPHPQSSPRWKRSWPTPNLPTIRWPKRGGSSGGGSSISLVTAMDKAKSHARRALKYVSAPVLDDQFKRNIASWQISEALALVKYLALSQLVSRQLPPEMPLAAHALSVFSQNGEDGILFELCRRISVPHTFVEFGVGPGSQGNCVLLADVFGWSGLFIEYNEKDYPQLESKYANTQRVQTLQKMVTPETINSIFKGAGVDSDLGILSIDIDGNDYWVWKAVSDYRPAIVVIEYNSSLPYEVLVQPYTDDLWDGTMFSGASLRALEELGAAKGYDLVHADLAGVNAFFVRHDLRGDLPTGDEVMRHGVNYYLLSSAHRHGPSDRTDWETPQA
jgi:hypothetical protein